MNASAVTDLVVDDRVDDVANELFHQQNENIVDRQSAFIHDAASVETLLQRLRIIEVCLPRNWQYMIDIVGYEFVKKFMCIVFVVVLMLLLHNCYYFLPSVDMFPRSLKIKIIQDWVRIIIIINIVIMLYIIIIVITEISVTLARSKLLREHFE